MDGFEVAEQFEALCISTRDKAESLRVVRFVEIVGSEKEWHADGAQQETVMLVV